MIEMNHSYIEKNDIVQRYIHGNLSAEELAEFEKYMLLNPDVMEDIELAHTFKRGLELSQVSTSGTAAKTNNGLFKWLWPAGGFAAGAFATLLMVGPMNLLVTGQVDRSPEIVYVETMRSVDSQSTMTTYINDEAVRQILVIDVSASYSEQTRYGIALKDEAENIIEQWKGLKANQRGELVIDAQLSSSDSHWLEVTRDGNQVLKTQLVKGDI